MIDPYIRGHWTQTYEKLWLQSSLLVSELQDEELRCKCKHPRPFSGSRFRAHSVRALRIPVQAIFPWILYGRRQFVRSIQKESPETTMTMWMNPLDSGNLTSRKVHHSEERVVSTSKNNEFRVLSFCLIFQTNQAQAVEKRKNHNFNPTILRNIVIKFLHRLGVSPSPIICLVWIRLRIINHQSPQKDYRQ